jgi:hypothetical protein
MIYFDSIKMNGFDHLLEKFNQTKSWKKNFHQNSFCKILKSLLNLFIAKKKNFSLDDVDVKLYMFFIRVKLFDNISILTSLFILQDESIVLKLFGILNHSLTLKIENLRVYQFKGKNDLRLKGSMKFLFEKKNFYLNKLINTFFNFSKTDKLGKYLGETRKKIKSQLYICIYYFRVKMTGKTPMMIFNQF